MPETTTRELILLLLEYYDEKENGMFPYEVSTTGITDVLEIDQENMSERMKLISTLSDMKEEGLIEESVSEVEGFDDERNVYTLTQEGREYSEEVQDRVITNEITVRGEKGEYKTQLKKLDENISGPGLVRALARSREGVLDLRDSGSEDSFVNREEELDSLHNELVKVKRSGSRTVMVSGETGVGKTALLSRFEEVAHEKGFEFLDGKCPKGVSEPYHSLRNAFGDYLESHNVDLFDQDAPAIDEEEEVEAQRTALFHEVANFIDEVSTGTPLVVFIDDIHWIDRESAELLGFLIEKVEGSVMFVGAYRPEDVPESLDLVEQTDENKTESGYVRIDLSNFGVDETREVIERLTEGGSVPSDFVELVHEKTGGNPLFIRESVKQMLEEDVVRPKEDFYPSEGYEIPVPDRIEETIERRLRSLDRRALEIVEWCAVIGDEIGFELLDELLEIDEPDLKDYLDVLRDARILSGDTETGFEFVNSIIRETVLNGLSENEKKVLHREIGDAIEKSSEEKEWQEYEKIGYHYDQAGESEDALEYYLEAGERAQRIYALEKSLDNYERTLKISRGLDDSQKELSVVIDLAYTYYLSGEYDEADNYFDYVWERADDEEALMKVSRYKSRMKKAQGKHGEGIEIANRGLDQWDGETPSEEVRSLLSSKGWALQEQGKFEEASEIYERQLEIAHELDDASHIGSALHDLGTLQMYRDEIQEAKESLKESIEKLDDADDRRHLSNSVNNLGIVYLKEGNLEEARQTFARALEIHKETGDTVGMTSTLLNLGVMSDLMGDWQSALEYYEEALEKSQSVGKMGTLATVNENLGEVYFERGNLDKSLEHLERSMEISKEVGVKHNETHTCVSLSRYYRTKNDLEEALYQAKHALELAEEVGATNLKALALNSLADTEFERGNIRDAEEYQRESVKISEDAEERNKVEARYGLVKILLSYGDLEEAYDLATEAFQIAEGMTDMIRELQAEKMMGMVLREKGEYGKAEKKLESALDISRDLGSKYDECDSLFELGKLEKKRGNDEEARRFFDEGMEIAEESGFVLYQEKFEKEQ